MPCSSSSFRVFQSCLVFWSPRLMKRQRTSVYVVSLFEPRHDKTINMTVHPAKTQISLGISPVWAESPRCAYWVAKDPRFLHADNEDSNQTGRMPRLIWVFAGRTLISLVLSWRSSFLIRNIVSFFSFSRFRVLVAAYECVTPWIFHLTICKTVKSS